MDTFRIDRLIDAERALLDPADQSINEPRKAKPRPTTFADRGLMAFAQLQLTTTPLALVQLPLWVMPCPGVELVLP
jgi:hypothetical protein